MAIPWLLTPVANTAGVPSESLPTTTLPRLSSAMV